MLIEVWYHPVKNIICLRREDAVVEFGDGQVALDVSITAMVIFEWTMIGAL